MGISNVWRGVKAFRAVAQAANAAAAEGSQSLGSPPQGLATGLGNVLAQALAPQMEAKGEVRGAPLRGSEPAIIDGTAWRQPVAAQAALLRARDTAFSVELLESFAVQVAAAVSATWSGADPGDVRMIMGDALWEPFAAALTQMRAVAAKRAARAAERGTTPQPLAGLPLVEGQPTGARLTGLHVGPWYHSALLTIHVRLRADYLAKLNAASEEERERVAVKFHGADVTEWDEDWLFQRSGQPGGEPMIEPPACPACGAATRPDEQGRCLYCQQLVPFLTTGWLATMIVSHHPMYALQRERHVAALMDDPERGRERLEMLTRMSPRMAEQIARRAGIDPRTLPGGPR